MRKWSQNIVLIINYKSFTIYGIQKNFGFPLSKIMLLQGGLVLVSHDERLIEIVCTELWVVRNMRVDRLEGGLAEYRKLVCKELGLA